MTIGSEGFILPANTLLETALQIVNGVKPGLTATDLGFTKMTTGNIINSSSYTYEITITHGLGVVPKIFLLYTTTNPSTYPTLKSYLYDFSSKTPVGIVKVDHSGNCYCGANSSATVTTSNITVAFGYYINTSTIGTFRSGQVSIPTGTKMYWLALA